MNAKRIWITATLVVVAVALGMVLAGTWPGLSDRSETPRALTGSVGSPSSSATGPATPSQALAPDAPASATPTEGAASAEVLPVAQTTTPAPSAVTWGPSAAQVKKATADAAAMSLADVAGQVIVGTYDGTSAQAATSAMTSQRLGGVILMSPNISSQAQIRSVTAAVRTAQKSMGRNWPALIGIDEEGGVVSRLAPVAPKLPDFMSAGAAISGRGTKGAAVVTAAGRAQADLLRRLGITNDFAPDADVTSGLSDPTIGTRSPSENPTVAGKADVAFAAGMHAGGVLTSVKHFPGHGALSTDSHKGLPVQKATLAALKKRDLVPFAYSIDHGIPMVMVGHIAATAFEAGVPASLSPAAYTYLRKTMGFRGVTITDALNMGAVVQTYGPGQACVKAMKAGADVLLMPANSAAARSALVAAVKDGTLSRARLNQAAGRMIALMRHQATLASGAGALPADPSAALRKAARALSAAAVTVTKGSCPALPLKGTVHLIGGTSTQWNAAYKALTAAGVKVLPLEQKAYVRVQLVDRTPVAGSGVTVALQLPDVLDKVPNTTGVALYGDTPEAFAALAAVLAGKARATCAVS